MAITGLYNMEILQDLNTQWNRSKYTKLQKKYLPNKKNDKVLTILVTNFIKIVLGQLQIVLQVIKLIKQPIKTL